ncbi:MarR family winged helix-turn-helix transcriptional regulator [Microbacterium protaetiae]|uniref:MarR family winged helix-turn-helix transcriptional regulator n=1 Tax=Microbacterium protaetiae TaxID=2509458 RepID=UPI001A92A4F3|nr:MarR family transcriptional regulator [Microbacterium protaetiae]
MDEPAGDQPLSRAIFRIARAHKSLAARLLRGAGLRPGQELVLMTLWDEGPQRQVDLVEALESDAGTMTRSLARLEKAGLVRRRPSPTDGRAVIVEVTEAGLALRAQVDAAWAELESTTRGALPDDRVAQVIADLADLEQNVSDALVRRRDDPAPVRTVR